MKHRPKTSPPAATIAPTFVVVRTPLLSIDEIAFLHEPSAFRSPQELDASRAAARSRLVELLDRPEVCEALVLASPSLAARIPSWRSDPLSRAGQQTESALVRYVSRMGWRSTPFGLLAGFSHARLAGAADPPGEPSHFELAPRAAYRRCSRLDMTVCEAVTQAAVTDPEARASLGFVPNDAMYVAGGRLQVPRITPERRYEQIAITIDDGLQCALERARVDRRGATLGQIAEALLPLGVELDEAFTYACELAEAAVLVPAARPTLTGEDFAGPLAAALGPRSRLGSALSTARAAIGTLAGLPLGSGERERAAVHDAIAAVLPRIEAQHVLQVDLQKPLARATLARSVVDDVAAAARALHRIFGASEDPPALVAFRRAFERRYETRAVPLMEVLDDEIGIGFPEPQARTADPVPLLDGLGLPGGEHVAFPTPPAAGLVDAFLFEKLAGALRSGASVVTIDDDDVARFVDAPRLPLPDSLAATATLHTAPPLLVLGGVMGPSAARLVARFCPWDEGLTADVREHLRAEEAIHPDAVFAEVVHLPDGSRAGNVLLRPVLREHEIAFAARGAGAETLALDDLLVTVRDDRIVLSSRRLGREIVPRLSSAHNYMHRQLPVYRFLCRLQEQGVTTALAWSWGPFAGAPRLPRVVHRGVVLSPARFRLDAPALGALAAKTPLERLEAARRLRRELDLPRTVALEDGDNLLTVDLESSLAVDALAATVRSRRTATLVEVLGADETDPVVRGPEGRFRHELVIPLLRAQSRARTTVPPRSPSPVVRHLPGGPWLYAKLYQGRRSADRVLASCVRPIVTEVLASGAADAFFFVRYADPDPHLRIRFHGAPSRLLAEVLPRIAERALDESAGILRMQLDTYEPEIERYGGGIAMPLVERFFHADSLAALALLGLAASAPDPERARWAATLLSMDALVEESELDPGSRRAFLERVRGYFAAEMRAEGGERDHAIARRHREERAYVEALLGAALPPPAGAMRSILARRRETTAPLLRELRALDRAGELVAPFEDVLASLLHMTANRLLHAHARQQELVLTTFLARTYASREARVRS